MIYQNFDVELSLLPDGNILIRVESPSGEARAAVVNAFTPADVQSILADLGGVPPQRGSIYARQPNVPPSVRQIGERLFRFIFDQREIAQAYFGSLTRLGENDGLRIRLSVENAGVLSQLPWELMVDPRSDTLALSNRSPIVRYTQQLTTRTIQPITLPLRVLVMISSPKDYGMLDVEREWKTLNDATQPLQAQGLIQLERMDYATLTELQRKLNRQVYHVFHYIGHSDYDAASQQGVLVFENVDNLDQGQLVLASELSQRLADERTLRLVVLNSCHSARRVENDPFRGIASSLVAREIPAVVAMQFEITDSAAIVFAREFYRTFAEFFPIDRAVSEGRLAVAGEVRNSEWVTPVLYMRSPDGRLFKDQRAPDDVDITLPDPHPSERESRLPSVPTIAPPPTLRADALPPLQPPGDLPPARRRIPLWLASAIGVALLLVVLVALLSPILNLTPPITVTPSQNPTDDGTNTPAPNLAPPNLIIGRIRVGPTEPAPGQFFRVNVTITNAGESDSGAFNWSWDASQGEPVQQNNASGSVDNIPPGASKTVSFPYLYGWWGEYTAQFLVDLEGEVDETNELDNRQPFPITLANVPFSIDFTLLPDTSIVEPPRTLGSDEFAPWRLDFLPAVPQSDPCIGANIQLSEVDFDGGDIVLNIQDEACADRPLSVRITRGAISDAQVVLLPGAAGEGVITYFNNTAGTQLIAQTAPTALTPDEPGQIGGVGIPAQIRRLDISATNQLVRLTRLILFPPS